MRAAMIALLVGSSVLLAAVAGAETPRTLSYQAVLRDSLGNVVADGEYSMTFGIYDEEVGGSPLWSESQMVHVEDGMLNVVLGSADGIGLPFDQQYWLGVSVWWGPELAPRTKLAGAPYAARAAVADVGSDNDWTIDGDDVYKLTGRVGIGMTPSARPGNVDERLQSVDARGRSPSKLSLDGESERVLYSQVREVDDGGDGRAAVYGLRSRSVAAPGSGYAESQTNSAVAGFNVWGDAYTFGVTGFSWNDFGRSAGVLGAEHDGSPWAALGYRDEYLRPWGVYSPDNAYVGGRLGVGLTSPSYELQVQGTACVNGFRLPPGGADGYVLTSDDNGTGWWEPPQTGLGGVGTSGRVAKFTAATTLGNSQITDSGISVGIGTTSPTAFLDVQTPAPVTAANIERTASPGLDSNVLQLKVPDSPTSFRFLNCQSGSQSLFRVTGSGGLFASGFCEIEDNLTVEGRVDVVTASGRAGQFTSSYGGSGAEVVRAEYTGNATDAVAVRGVSAPADYHGTGGSFHGGYIGARGTVTPTGNGIYYGLWGSADGGTGDNYGVLGEADGGGHNCGVLGMGGLTGVNYAGMFVGDVWVTGRVTKGSGSFKIDHPLDPERKYLYHSFVESPDMMNIYNGNVKLDGAGEAWIVLPEWFEALNRDFRYQLTCIGSFAPVYVADTIVANRFRIAGGEPGMEVSWQVTGVRRDPFAERYRIPVEEDKPPDEIGTYVHPEVYGMPETMAVTYGVRREVARGKSVSD